MRVFVAAWPDDPTRAARPVGTGVGTRRAVGGAQQWHVTLRFLGDVSEDLVPALIDALVDAAQRCRVPSTARWARNSLVRQPAGAPATVTGLDEVAEAVRSVTIPIVPDSRIGEPAFTGHVTIARTSGSRINRSARSDPCRHPILRHIRHRVLRPGGIASLR